MQMSSASGGAGAGLGVVRWALALGPVDRVCGAVAALRTVDGMTEIAVSPEEVAALGVALVEVATTLGDLEVLAPAAGWLPPGPARAAFEEVVTTWRRQRLRLEQSLGDLAAAAAAAGAVYLDVEDEAVASLRPGRGGPR